MCLHLFLETSGHTFAVYLSLRTERTHTSVRRGSSTRRHFPDSLLEVASLGFLPARSSARLRNRACEGSLALDCRDVRLVSETRSGALVIVSAKESDTSAALL